MEMVSGADELNLERLRKQLKHDEGVVPHAYQDSEGWWTIGVGRLIDERKGGKISPKEIEYLLDNDIERVRISLEKEWNWFVDLNDARQEVLANMCFNLGLAGLKKFKLMIAAIERQDWADAAREMLDSKWSTQVGDRAVRLSEAMRTGQWV
jgi:lysozyme